MPLIDKRVMVACVTFDTYKIVNPAVSFKVDKIYLVHYVKDGKREGVYYKFFERTSQLLKENIKDIEIVDSEELFGSTPVYEFNTMLKVLLNIMRREERNHVYVNISAGSAEYSAAATVASMMNREFVTPFSVNTKEFTIPNDMIEDLYFRNIGGKKVPVGLALDTKEPSDFMTFHIDKPDDDLIKALSILYRHGKPMKSSDIMRAMTKEGLWDREDGEEILDQAEKTKNKNSNSVYFFRTYIEKWKEMGWVEQDVHKRYVITERGRNDVEVFLFKGLDQE